MALLFQFRPEAPLCGAILLGVKAFMPIPTSRSQKWQRMAKKGIVRPIVKPDLDNLLKNIKDCLTTMQFWEDDKQVVGYLPDTGKYYSDLPRWEIEILPFVGDDIYPTP